MQAIDKHLDPYVLMERGRRERSRQFHAMARALARRLGRR